MEGADVLWQHYGHRLIARHPSNQTIVLIMGVCSLTDTQDGGSKKIFPNQTHGKTTHHEARWATWSLNAFETGVSWWSLQAKMRCQSPLINVPHVDALAYSSSMWELQGPIQNILFPLLFCKPFTFYRKQPGSLSPSKLYFGQMSPNFQSSLSTDD